MEVGGGLSAEEQAPIKAERPAARARPAAGGRGLMGSVVCSVLKNKTGAPPKASSEA